LKSSEIFINDKHNASLSSENKKVLTISIIFSLDKKRDVDFQSSIAAVEDFIHIIISC